MNYNQLKVLPVMLILAGAGVLVYHTLTAPTIDQQTPAVMGVEKSYEVSEDRVVITVPATEAVYPATTTPQQPDGPQSYWYYSDPIVFDDPLVVSGFDFTVEGADDVTLHHVSVTVPERTRLLCENYFLPKGNAEIFTASRNTRHPLMLPEPYGVVIEPGEPVVVEFMTHPVAQPHSPHQPDQAIAPVLKITLHTDDARTTSAHFARLRLDDTPCADPYAHQAFAVPANETLHRFSDLKQSTRDVSDRLTFTQDGKIVTTGANFWPRKGGKNVSLYLDEALVRTHTAEAGAESWLWDIPAYDEPIPFTAGTEVTISSLYENTFDVPIKDASGMLGMYYTYEEPIDIAVD